MRICFYYEYKNIVGGVTSLLLTLIKELRKQQVEVVLFNFDDGLIAAELARENIDINLIDINRVNWQKLEEVVYPTDVFVITGLIEVFHRFFKVNPRMVFYNINDYLCDISNYRFGLSFKSLAKRLIREWIKADALLLMDDTGIRNAAEQLSLKIGKPIFLPVPVTVPATNTYLQTKRKIKNAIRLTYIGRSVDWKMYPLKKILDDVSHTMWPPEKEVHVSIAVDSITDLKKFIDMDRYEGNERLKVTLYEKIKPSAINDFLLSNSDLNFGMGTSALEGAKLGIPSILMDFSTKEMPVNYIYNWLYNAEYYSLGRNAEKSYTPAAEGVTMASLFQAYFTDENYVIRQSEKSFNYVQQHHGVGNIVASLIRHAEKTRFRLVGLQPYNLHYSFLHLKLKSLLSKN